MPGPVTAPPPAAAASTVSSRSRDRRSRPPRSLAGLPDVRFPEDLDRPALARLIAALAATDWPNLVAPPGCCMLSMLAVNDLAQLVLLTLLLMDRSRGDSCVVDDPVSDSKEFPLLPRCLVTLTFDDPV